MAEKQPTKIVVTENGPYHVLGDLSIAMQTIVPNREGMSWDWKEGPGFPSDGDVFLCRCGQSSSKPFCDGSHATVGFDGTETARRDPYDRLAEAQDGPTMRLQDEEALCAFARFCDPGGKIWALIDQTNSEAARELVAREGGHCPSGRLVVTDKKSGARVEPKLPPSIGVVEDPALRVSGPLWVRGGVPIESADGTPYEVRNRVTLCRCGASSNKPFCDGSHASIKFRDGIRSP